MKLALIFAVYALMLIPSVFFYNMARKIKRLNSVKYKQCQQKAGTIENIVLTRSKTPDLD
jgi:hypothetical protein